MGFAHGNHSMSTQTAMQQEVRVMRIAVSACQPNLRSDVDTVFGKCAYFIVVDMESNEFEAYKNENARDPAYAGVQVARFLSRKGVHAVITGVIGPQALQVLSGAGIEVYTGVTSQVRKALQAFHKGKLLPTSHAAGLTCVDMSAPQTSKESRKRKGKAWW